MYFTFCINFWTRKNRFRFYTFINIIDIVWFHVFNPSIDRRYNFNNRSITIRRILRKIIIGIFEFRFAFSLALCERGAFLAMASERLFRREVAATGARNGVANVVHAAQMKDDAALTPVALAAHGTAELEQREKNIGAF